MAGGGLGILVVVVSFFQRRVKNSLFGIVYSEEKVVWEQWIIPVNLFGSLA